MVKSAELYELTIPYSQDVLAEATLDVIRANKLESAYIRPIAFFGAATLSVWTTECPVEIAIAAFPTGQYLAGAAAEPAGPAEGDDAGTAAADDAGVHAGARRPVQLLSRAGRARRAQRHGVRREAHEARGPADDGARARDQREAARRGEQAGRPSPARHLHHLPSRRADPEGALGHS